MKQLEVFFDYACPYCLEAHESLRTAISSRPEIEVVWRPCEAHPRPDRYRPHSDLCIQGMFFAQECGVDLWDYHALMYRAALQDRIDIENPRSLASYAGALLEPGALLSALATGRFRQPQEQANQYAFQQNDVWVVPAYRMDGKRLDATENVGVTLAQLEYFLDT